MQRGTDAVTILGIDPGSRVTGFGLVRAQGDRLALLGAGHIATGKGEFQQRLRTIFDEISHLTALHQPDEVAIERVFVHRNADSALKLGHARAAALCATFGSSLPVYEYAAREVKKAVVGKGAADKHQVQHMVRVLLAVQGELQADAADALAVAVCHAHSRRARGRLAAMALAGSH